MSNPSFKPKTIVQIANELLLSLYDNTEGDQWKYVDIAKIYNQEVTSSFSSANEALRNNVIQHLLERKFIEIDQNHEKIAITYEGKRFVYKNHPGFKND